MPPPDTAAAVQTPTRRVNGRQMEVLGVGRAEERTREPRAETPRRESDLCSVPSTPPPPAALLTRGSIIAEKHTRTAERRRSPPVCPTQTAKREVATDESRPRSLRNPFSEANIRDGRVVKRRSSRRRDEGVQLPRGIASSDRK